MVAGLMTVARAAHIAGVNFNDFDAIGARGALTGGAGLFAGGSVDAVLNLEAGEFSMFASPEGGFILGESLSVVGGFTLIKNLPSNGDFRGGFMAAGLVGGDVVGLNTEIFWSSPMADSFNPFDKTHGGFIGVGAAIPSVGGYGSYSYSFELFRENSEGGHLFPHTPSVIDIAKDIGWTIRHDILSHPIWPWSPYR